MCVFVCVHECVCAMMFAHACNIRLAHILCTRRQLEHERLSICVSVVGRLVHDLRACTCVFVIVDAIWVACARVFRCRSIRLEDYFLICFDSMFFALLVQPPFVRGRR